MPSKPDGVMGEWHRDHVGREDFGTSPDSNLILEEER